MLTTTNIMNKDVINILDIPEDFFIPMLNKILQQALPEAKMSLEYINPNLIIIDDRTTLKYGYASYAISLKQLRGLVYSFLLQRKTYKQLYITLMHIAHGEVLINEDGKIIKEFDRWRYS